MRYGRAVVVASLLGLLLLPVEGAAQLREVQQTVYGMDCAPCAYALEKRVKRLNGVRQANVSLDNGRVHILFDSQHSVTVASIRSAVTESGFSAEEASIRVSGTLQQKGNVWMLRAAGERFVLTRAPDTAKDDTVVTLTGRVPKNRLAHSEAWALDIESDLR